MQPSCTGRDSGETRGLTRTAPGVATQMSTRIPPCMATYAHVALGRNRFPASTIAPSWPVASHGISMGGGYAGAATGQLGAIVLAGNRVFLAPLSRAWNYSGPARITR